MKIRLLLYIFLILKFCSCQIKKKENVSKKYKELCMTQYDWHLFNDEINKPKSDENAYCFTVNYPSCYGCPVIKYELDGKELMFLVDTGYTSTFLTKEGLKCFFIDEQEMLQTFLYDYYLKKWNMKHEGNDYSDVLIQHFFEDTKSGKYVPTFSSQNFKVDYNNTVLVHGIIGQDFLQKHNRVTFDFVDKTIRFNDEELKDSCIIPFKSYVNMPDVESIFIQFENSGKKEWGEIDTGSPMFTPRNGINKNSFSYDFSKKQEYSMYATNKIRKTIPKIIVFNEIIIGNIKYHEIKGMYANIYGSAFNTGAQIKMQDISNLGCCFFYNHIMQIDYDARVIRMK